MLLVYTLYFQLNTKEVSSSQFYQFFLTLTLEKIIFAALAILLMPINWFLESFKWKKLVNVIQRDFHLFDAIQGILIGVFFGFLTPNRIGEFGGRLFKIASGNKVKALNLSLVGGFAQFVITFLFGMFGSFSLLSAYFELNYAFAYWCFVIIFMVTIIIYFNFKQIIKFIFSYEFFRKFSAKYVFNFDFTNFFLLKILVITFLRYCIYVLQYVLILYFLGVDLDIIFLFKTISTMLLIQTIIPSFTLIDVGIRGNVLLFLLSDFVENQIVILICVLLVWILNLVIPAIVGYVNFINLKLEVKNEKFNNHIVTNNRK